MFIKVKKIKEKGINKFLIFLKNLAEFLENIVEFLENIGKYINR